MNTLPPCYGIIPARYDSHRFPGKPLVKISGKPMFQHVVERARQCREFQQVILATDDERIFQAAAALEIRVVMTRKNHVSGTDRVLEAAEIIGAPEDAVVVNIQGDEPALEPSMLSQLIALFAQPEVQVATLAREIDAAEAANPDRVKVVFAKDAKALYFSRFAIPYTRDAQHSAPLFVHIGIYGFRMAVLRKFVELGPSSLEISEKLEQLRLLENGIPIHIAVTTYQNIGVDRPEDLAIIEDILRRQTPAENKLLL